MTSNRFQEAKRIYSAALERESGQRDAYLSEACAGDDTLRKEVESLLGYWTEAQEFFEAPAIEAGAKALARESPTDFSGRTLSHYTILEKIGEGGMGSVYQARDTHLDRLVALKILPPEKVIDPDRKRRFVQEARAASALNHPNIVVIHDIDTADGITFIAMEYVKGWTLGELIRVKNITVKETLKYGAQIADALAAAHSSGIIHRDIKPANIMVTDSGLVKVLDFGLAKLTEPPESGQHEPPRTLGQKTEAGVILGTVAYMSPEQSEGKEVDARSDIFSLGSVLYEMMSGRRAFSGGTNVSTLAAILRDEPEPVSQLAPEIPRKLESAVSRCLQKSPEQRFQHMSDLKLALEELKEESDSGTLAPGVGRPTRRLRRLVWGAGACLLAVMLAVGTWFGLRPQPIRPPALVKAFTGLPGAETRPAFSPDGKQLAFSWNGEKQDNFDIYVLLVDETTPRRLTSNPALDYSPAWSPDALHIAFLRDTPAGTEVIIIPAAGGAERTLHVSPVRTTPILPFCGLAWSPNGRFLAIVDRASQSGSNSIFLLDIETRERLRLTTPPAGFWDGLPSFSPDGGGLAFTRGHDRPLSDIYIQRLSQSGQPRAEPRRITYDNTFIYGLDWTANGRSIVFSSTRGGVWALWQVPASGGEPERLPVGGNNAFWPAVSKTGNRLAYGEGVDDWNIWRVAAPGGGATGEAAAPTRISPSPQVDQEPAFSPDGRSIVWSSMHSGSHQIWIAKQQGSQPSQVTHLDPPGAAEPQWSPDGRQIAFNGYRRGPHQVYVIGADGGSPRRLTTGDFDEDVSSWSRDSKWVYFGSNRGEGEALWKAPVGGGPPVLVARNGWGPVESLDGKSVYYSGLDSSVWKVSASGGSPILVARNGWGPAESFDGKFVYYSGSEPSIWRVPTVGGEPARMLTTGPRASWTLASAGVYVLDPDAKGGPSIEWFPFRSRRTQVVRLPGKQDTYGRASHLSAPSVSPDGRWILYVHVDRAEADIMLVENFR